MWRYIFVSLFFVISLVTQSQGTEENINSQSRVSKLDSLQGKPNWSPHELKVGMNLLGVGITAFNPSVTHYELQGMLAMHHLIVVMDVGREIRDRGSTYQYRNEGNYFRLGGDWNFIKTKKAGNLFSLGLRYAQAFFSDRLAYTSDDGFGTVDYLYANNKLRARWAEVDLSIRGQMVANLYMGFTLRWQILRKVKGEGELQTFDVPGFGNTKRPNSTAFDYYVAWRIPLLKKKRKTR